jgi:hypothetical protein
VTEAYFNLTLKQGNYYLVIENMGQVSGQSTNRGTAEVYCLIGLPEEGFVINQMAFTGFLALESNVYIESPFTLNKTISVVSFNITASNPVSLFVTSLEGVDEFFTEVFVSPRDRSPPIDPQLQFFLVLAGTAVIVIIFVGYQRLRVKEDQVMSSVTTNISELWKCPTDGSPLQFRTPSTYAQNPQFMVTRQNLKVGVDNAVALKKISPEAANYTEEVVRNLFSQEPSLEFIEMVGAYCKKCGRFFSAPKKEL